MKNPQITQEEIDEQIKLSEARGQKVVDFLDKYKGQPIYNEIALAIEFGYQLCLEDFEEMNDPEKPEL